MIDGKTKMKNFLINSVFATIGVVLLVGLAFLIDFLYVHYALQSFLALVLIVAFIMCYLVVALIRE